jgi:hypothetical protein
MCIMELNQVTNDAVRGLRWGEEARLRAIDAAAFWEGRVNRAGLMRRFGISVPQATIDLRAYQRLAPDNLCYDTREKAYLATEAFKPLFGPPEAELWLLEAAGAPASGVPVAMNPMPPRLVDPWLLRRVVAARRSEKALRVSYQSMEVPEPVWVWIAPSAFGFDGIRWHLRAYNFDAARYEDLLFPRILEIDGERPSDAVPVDEDWERIVDVRIAPAARLSASQKAVIWRDYGMEDGEVTVPVRAAMLGLFLRRLRLDLSDGLMEVLNRAELEAVQREVAGRFGE